LQQNSQVSKTAGVTNHKGMLWGLWKHKNM